MKKLHILGVAIVAVLAFGAIAVASASAAVTFLLADWLLNGAVTTTKVPTSATGEILLEDRNALKLGIAAKVLCSGILDGTVGPESEDEITEVLSLTGESISLTALSGTFIACTGDASCETPHVWAVHLPWNTELELWEEGTESGFVILILEKGTSGKPGWYVECTVLGTKITDECLAEAIGGALAENETGGVLTEFLESFTELMELKLALCSSSGEESGVVEGPGLETAPSGTLTVSE